MFLQISTFQNYPLEMGKCIILKVHYLVKYRCNQCDSTGKFYHKTMFIANIRLVCEYFIFFCYIFPAPYRLSVSPPDQGVIRGVGRHRVKKKQSRSAEKPRHILELTYRHFDNLAFCYFLAFILKIYK